MLFAAPASAQDGRVVTNAEYGVTITLPADVTVCGATSWTHPHGFYAWLDRPTDCDATTAKVDTVMRAMSVWADYNAAFIPDLARAKALYCDDDPGAQADADRFGALSVPGHESVQCLTIDAEGAIEIDIYAAAGGPWCDGPDPDCAAPYAIYRVSLQTVEAALEDDLRTFRAMLQSATLEPERL